LLKVNQEKNDNINTFAAKLMVILHNNNLIFTKCQGH